MTPERKAQLRRQCGLKPSGYYGVDARDVVELLDALDAAERERDELRAAVEKAREAMQRSVSDCHDSHYAHHDPKGTAGANCPACIERRDDRDRLSEALASLPRTTEGGST